MDDSILKNRILEIINAAELSGRPCKWGHNGAGLVKRLSQELNVYYDEPVKKTRVKIVVDECIDEDLLQRYKDARRNSWFVRCTE